MVKYKCASCRRDAGDADGRACICGHCRNTGYCTHCPHCGLPYVYRLDAAKEGR